MKNELNAWVISVNMGLGHQRATYPLSEIAYNGIQMIGEKSTSSKNEIALWERMTRAYESLSRIKKVPLIGQKLFNLVDKVQNISPYYPKRDLSSPSIQSNIIRRYIKKGLGQTLLTKIKERNLPIVSSYPVPALILDYAGIEKNYCIICDAQISRVWVPKYPEKSQIKYFAPCGRAVMRLKRYGVPEDKIFLTGFPFPKEILGSPNLELLKYDVSQRLHYLDPNDRFWPLHKYDVRHFLGSRNIKFKNKRILSLTFAVGGAGAQIEIGATIAKSLRKKILDNKIKLNLVAGIRKEVYNYFRKTIKNLDLPPKAINIVYGKTINEYFNKFSSLIRETDILWTKPSELSFFCGLGIPIIIAPPIGIQEVYNKKWLMEVQAGIIQENPEYTNEWLFDLLKEGRLAEAAWDGFLKARKCGTFKIEEILATGTVRKEKSPIIR